MSESEISCPKCGGHMVFPTELAEQAIACPHCGESILLPKQSKKTVRLLASALVASVAALAGALFWGAYVRHGGEANSAETRPPRTLSEATAKQQSETKRVSKDQSADELAFESLAKEFYRCLNEADTKSLRSFLAASCSSELTDDDLAKGFKRGDSYTYLGIDSVSYRQSDLGKCALVRVRRIANTGFGNQEAIRDFKFVKEAGGWKMFRDHELAEKIVDQFFNLGLTDGVRSTVQLLRKGDPFGNWDVNDTNAFESVFKLVENQSPVFPWQIGFSVRRKHIDGRILYLGFAVRNLSSNSWDSPFLEFQLKRDGKTVSSANELLATVMPGQETEIESPFFLRDVLQQNAKFDLDVSYSLGLGKCQLVRNMPVEFQVVKPTDLVKFEVVKASFDLAKTVDDSTMWVARLDHRIRNISKENVKDMVVKCVWTLQNGEVLDQSSDYVLGFGDVPLGPRQVKSGFIRCGKGYGYGRVPVKVDVYLESGDQRAQVINGLLIK